MTILNHKINDVNLDDTIFDEFKYSLWRIIVLSITVYYVNIIVSIVTYFFYKYTLHTFFIQFISFTVLLFIICIINLYLGLSKSFEYRDFLDKVRSDNTYAMEWKSTLLSSDNIYILDLILAKQIGIFTDIEFNIIKGRFINSSSISVGDFELLITITESLDLSDKEFAKKKVEFLVNDPIPSTFLITLAKQNIISEFDAKFHINRYKKQLIKHIIFMIAPLLVICIIGYVFVS